MKWLLGASIFVVCLWLWTLREPATTPGRNWELAPDMRVEGGWHHVWKQTGNAAASEFAAEESRVSQAQNQQSAPVMADKEEGVNVSYLMDPNDPSTWPKVSGAVSQTGDPHMNPADPSTWPTLTGEVDESGDPFMDPNDPLTWPLPEEGIQDSEEPDRDPNDPFTWQPPPERHSDAANEDRNPYDPSTWD